MFKGEAAKQMRELIKNGTFGFEVFSKCNDLNATYLELKEKEIGSKNHLQKNFMRMKRYLSMTTG